MVATIIRAHPAAWLSKIPSHAEQVERGNADRRGQRRRRRAWWWWAWWWWARWWAWWRWWEEAYNSKITCHRRHAVSAWSLAGGATWAQPVTRQRRIEKTRADVADDGGVHCKRERTRPGECGESRDRWIVRPTLRGHAADAVPLLKRARVTCDFAAYLECNAGKVRHGTSHKHVDVPCHRHRDWWR